MKSNAPKTRDWLSQWKEYEKETEGSPVFETHWHPYLEQYKGNVDEIMEVVQSA